MLHRGSGKDKDNASSASSNREDVEDEAERDRSEDRGSGERALEPGTADRIAELERALEVAKEEQNGLKEELAKVQQHELVFRETIDEYRRQLAGTYHQTKSPPGAFQDSHPASPRSTSISMEYEDIERRNSFDQREDILEHNYELRSKLAQLQDQLISQENIYQSRLNQASTRNDAEWNELTSRLHVTEKESQERLQQLLSLKSSISSLTRMDSQITDSELSESLSQLANRVREWVISNFRRTKLELSNIPPETVEALKAVSPNYKSISPSDRLALYQALISNTMMHLFRDPIIIGLPETGPFAPIRQLAAFMHDAGAEYREWRRTTIRCLEKSEAKHALLQEKEKSIHRLSNEIGHQLFTLTSMNVTGNAQSGLEGILNAAADLQHTLLLQKAQYRVVFFRNQESQQIYFDERRMESINDLDDSTDEDGDVVVDRKFAFCVFPCLEKFGDEYGENAEVSNVLLKARVCCGVG